ncbi:MAG: YdaS family helix-turn-helix protein [Sphingobium limneticum]
MANGLTPFEALKEALSRACSQANLAAMCGVGQPAVSKWLQSGKRLPADYVLAVEAATGVSRHLLRPDIYPLSEAPQGIDPGEDCGGIIPTPVVAVACEQESETQRKDAA